MKTLNIFISAVFLFNSVMTAAPMANANGNRRPLPPHLQEQNDILEVFEKAGVNPRDYRVRFQKENPNDQSGKRHILIEFPEFGGTWAENPGRTQTMTIEIPKSTPAELDSYLPSKIEQQLLRAEAQIKAAGKTGAHIVKDVTMRFPVETMKFALAIGAVSYFNLMMSGESLDPLVFSRQIESLNDPIAHIGFFTFMMVNGISVEVINKFMGLNKPIPEHLPAAARNALLAERASFKTYFVANLGMTFGSLASTIVHEVGHFPHLTDCALGRPPKDPNLKDQSSCDLASKEWMKYDTNDRLSAEAPILTSMLLSNIASTLIMSVGSSALRNASAGLAANQVLGLMSSNAAKNAVFKGFSFVIRVVGSAAGAAGVSGAAGAAASTTMSFVGGVFMFAFFIGLDQLLFQKPSRFVFNNFFGGSNLQAKQLDFIRSLMKAKSNNWFYDSNKDFQTVMKGNCETFEFNQYLEDPTLNGRCPNELELNFDRFHKKMSQWRQKQLEDITYSSENWKDLIANYISTYEATKSTYLLLLTEAYKRKSNGTQVELSEQTFPLNGIKLYVPVTDQGSYEVNQMAIMATQLMFLFDKTNSILSEFEKNNKDLLKANQNKPFYSYFAKQLKSEISRLKFLFPQAVPTPKILKENPTLLSKLNNLGKLFLELNQEIENSYSSFKYQSALRNLREQFSAEKNIPPAPILVTGEGFVKNYVRATPEMQSVAGWTLPNGSAINGLKVGNKFENYMASMIWGPQVGANTGMIADNNDFLNWGFYRSFVPPRIVKHDSATAIQWHSQTVYLDRTVRKYRKADFYRNPFYLLNSGSFGQVTDLNKVSQSDIKNQYQSIFEFLMDLKNYPFLQNNSAGTVEEKFNKWWIQNVNPPYMDGWKHFESEYKKIVFDLHQRMFHTGGSVLNPSSASNDLIGSISQQYRIYLAVLGDIYKYKLAFEPESLIPSNLAVRKYNQNFQIPKMLLPNNVQEPLEPYPVEKLGPGADIRMATGLDLLRVYSYTDYLDIDWLGRKFSGHIINNGIFKDPQAANFEFQEKALVAFKTVEQLLRKIVPAGGTGLKTEVTPTQLKTAIDELMNQVQELKNVFMPEDQATDESAPMDFRTRMVFKVLRALTEINSELMSYGANIFAVSYKAKYDPNGVAFDEGQRKNCNRSVGVLGKTTDKNCQTNNGH